MNRQLLRHLQEISQVHCLKSGTVFLNNPRKSLHTSDKAIYVESQVKHCDDVHQTIQLISLLC